MMSPTAALVYWGVVSLIAGIVTVYIALSGRR